MNVTDADESVCATLIEPVKKYRSRKDAQYAKENFLFSLRSWVHQAKLVSTGILGLES